ncbi:MAG TPA: pyridoxamine 5'-phosphate oxidase family protein [Candidatus Limnocylindria bacterium]|nr:pyridoxamine 5'-phosphate oxidase family protein [Candidatus Limnocylindria bacterium]
MATWAEFESAEPELAARARRLLSPGDDGRAMLATVRAAGAPRIHPISVAIVDGELLAFILPSAKLTDLETDGRYALHAQYDPRHPNELMLRGRVREVTDANLRAMAIGSWAFEPDDTYRLFAFDIESVLAGKRDSPSDWPPMYQRWNAV